MLQNNLAYSTTNAANLDLWGGWDGVAMTKVEGESGLVTDVLIKEEAQPRLYF